MKAKLSIRITLTAPTAGVDFGIQEGSGNQYKTIQKQRSEGRDLEFNFVIFVKNADYACPDFSGPSVHGAPNERFIYIDIGAAAGQVGSQWSRRLKVPLKDITMESPDLLLEASTSILITTVPGTGKDGGPNCGTVKPFAGWNLIRQ